ncbi:MULTISPECIES: ESX secretion-associated protein EspG [Prauserella salsuginis group]|uniref:ESX secretion-associated protein EspG n=1 Tax=Prauserella salsuginis TaxID=387889 RepID=A0ABW6G351_9PSEU|nr:MULTISPECIES: ESX secretion-associated protein EspG [Prauserella salsuginis group]MCR3718516.1 EspG family protein [Prauserella flava]MCR3733086.1 EspG family protein [Prauserella salsuginis]
MIRLSASAFDVLWSDLELGAPPSVLAVPSVGRTEDERASIRRDVYANLADRGLYPGELDEALRGRLAGIAAAAATIECEVLFDAADPEPLRGLVAQLPDGRGVLAVQPNRTIGLDAVARDRACAEAAAILPDVEGGPGHGVSLPSATLDTAADPVYEGGTGSRAHDRQVREVLAIQARPVLSAGQFSVYRREATRLVRQGGISWFLTDVGAYTAVVRPGPAGDPWLTVAPAGRERVAARLADLLAGEQTTVAGSPAAPGRR